MYTRPYDDNVGIVIPESYNGTTFRDGGRGEPMPEPSESIQASAQSVGDASVWKTDSTVHTENEKNEQAGSLFGKLRIGNLFGGIFENGNFSLQKIGAEEILIIATAAFLFFSKDGDKECAIMLLLLIFLT